MLTRLDRLLTWINKGLMVLGAAGLVALGLLIAGDIIGRTVFNRPIAGVAEAAAHLLVVVAFLQLPHSIRIGGMLRAEVVEMIAPAGVRRVLQIIGQVLGAMLFLTIAYYTWDPMVTTWVTGEFAGHPGFPVPVFPARFMVFTGSTLGALNFIVLAALTARPVATEQAESPLPEGVNHG